MSGTWHRIREAAYAITHRNDPSSVLCPPVRWDGEQWIPDGHQVTIREWFRLPKAERRRRAEEFRAADRALQSYRPVTSEEDETYLRFNARVDDLWGSVPWWCRS